MRFQPFFSMRNAFETLSHIDLIRSNFDFEEAKRIVQWFSDCVSYARGDERWKFFPKEQMDKLLNKPKRIAEIQAQRSKASTKKQNLDK
jgi:hypothetical protein